MNRMTDILRVAAEEYRQMTSHLSVLMVLAGGIFLYGLLYNYMYAPDVVRQVPVAVADESHTPLSRSYIRLLDATPQVGVARVSAQSADARRMLKVGRVEGIIYLPYDFDERVGRGEEAVFVSVSTTSAFLLYAAIQEATSGAMLALNDEVRPRQVVFLPPDDVAFVVQTPSIQVKGTALYNPTGGYATYLIPAVLMVILFQTMLMVISMRSGKEREERMLPLLRLTGGDVSWRSVATIVLGKAMTYVGFYLLFAVFLVGGLPLLFGLSHAASPWLLLCLLTPYLLATAFFGLACLPFYGDSDAPLLLIAFFSVGLIFLSGISYPLELMPWPWQVVHHLFPAPVGILSFIKAEGMGASLSDIRSEILLLWAQASVYFGLACWGYLYTQRRYI
ncbi:MAG: ABC transporter permease [Bacteroides sp.]|nr:ABC transporter permease [Bacteroides sp.]